MNDFITISCPSCGGQLKRDANTTIYTCDYCGQQHRLRVEDIEEFGRCPICRRNDRVEKVRAIHNNGGNLASRLAPPADPRKSLTYSPPPKPAPLDKPIKSRTKSKYTKIGFFLSMGLIVILYTFCCTASIFLQNVGVSQGLNFLLNFLVILFIISIFYLVYGSNKDKQFNRSRDQIILAAWDKQNQEQEKRWLAYKESYNSAYQEKSAQLARRHQKAMQRYDTLYYCHRDDCVFIPGKSGHAPSAKMEEFLFRGPA